MRKIREIFLYRPHYRRCIKTSFFARLYWLCFHSSFFFHFRFFFFPFWCIAIVCLSFMFCILLLFMLFFLLNSFVCFENLKILLRFFFCCRELSLPQTISLSVVFCIAYSFIVHFFGNFCYRVNSRTN